ncbi:glycosyltransferase involved in cell wall biosynthesis [Bradyrhizobium japonicum]|nr:glycosyltransferase involved in cell wall biosynthesis [Bradyrhizobium elkanii]NWL69375.1 glycosyltransferase family 1 protein [Bradyrhizobium elkanii]OIM92799.1 glycosyltransferase family 1 protein [Bradyrhizobium elkanii]UQD85344.1 glycosyltransferase [Bradyrhizobium elkanii USDA 76]
MVDVGRAGARPRILYIVPEDETFTTHFLEPARAARAAGFDVMVATFVRHQRDAIEREDFRLLEMPTERASLSLVSLLRSILRLRTILAEERPDLVHALSIRSIVLLGLSGPVGRKYPLLASFTGLGQLWGRAGWAAEMARGFVRLQACWLSRGRTALVSFENEDDRREFPHPADSVIFGGWGIEIGSRRSTKRSGDGPVRVAFLGRMLRSKGLATVVEAVSLARAQEPQIELELWGTPDPGNPTSYTVDELNQLTTIDGVAWMGKAPDIATVWERTDIAILLSESEGMPRALMEAAGYGIPMIATNVPGCRSVVRDGVDGFLVPLNDPVAAAEAIVRLARDPASRNHMGRMARQQFDERFSRDAVVPKILEIYSRLITNRENATLVQLPCDHGSQPILS